MEKYIEILAAALNGLMKINKNNYKLIIILMVLLACLFVLGNREFIKDIIDEDNIYISLDNVDADNDIKNEVIVEFRDNVNSYIDSTNIEPNKYHLKYIDLNNLNPYDYIRYKYFMMNYRNNFNNFNDYKINIYIKKNENIIDFKVYENSNLTYEATNNLENKDAISKSINDYLEQALYSISPSTLARNQYRFLDENYRSSIDKAIVSSNSYENEQGLVLKIYSAMRKRNFEQAFKDIAIYEIKYGENNFTSVNKIWMYIEEGNFDLALNELDNEESNYPREERRAIFHDSINNIKSRDKLNLEKIKQNRNKYKDYIFYNHYACDEELYHNNTEKFKSCIDTYDNYKESKSPSEKSNIDTRLVYYHNETKEHDVAFSIGEKALINYPNNPELAAAHILTLRNIGERDSAKLLLDKYIVWYPKNYPLIVQLIEYHLDEYQGVGKLGSIDANLMSMLFRSLVVNENKDTAIEYINILLNNYIGDDVKKYAVSSYITLEEYELANNIIEENREFSKTYDNVVLNLLEILRIEDRLSFDIIVEHIFSSEHIDTFDSKGINKILDQYIGVEYFKKRDLRSVLFDRLASMHYGSIEKAFVNTYINPRSIKPDNKQEFQLKFIKLADDIMELEFYDRLINSNIYSNLSLNVTDNHRKLEMYKFFYVNTDSYYIKNYILSEVLNISGIGSDVQAKTLVNLFLIDGKIFNLLGSDYNLESLISELFHYELSEIEKEKKVLALGQIELSIDRVTSVLKQNPQYLNKELFLNALKIAAENGSAHAQMYLAEVYYSGGSFLSNYHFSIKERRNINLAKKYFYMAKNNSKRASKIYFNLK